MDWTLENFTNAIEVLGAFENQIFNFSGSKIILNQNYTHSIEFHNCTIIADEVIFSGIRNLNLEIKFYNCEIKADLIIVNSCFQGLYFEDTRELKSLKLERGYVTEHCFEIEQFQFKNNTISNNILESTFDIRGCVFKNEFSIYGVNHSFGDFNLVNNSFGNDDDESFINSFMFQKSKINNVWFYKNDFKAYTSFHTCCFNRPYPTTGVVSFLSNKFKAINFNNCDFGDGERFTNCTFNDYTYFENNKNIINGHLKFINCVFNNAVSFNNTKIKEFELIGSTFKDIVSFQQGQFKQILIDKVSFEKGCYFDDLEIDTSLCYRKTLRNIKQQLQKTENRIDYNRFRSYELAAYYKELKWKRNFRDKFILGATWLVTGFDHSWRRALAFTIISGLAWYSIIYFAEYNGTFSLTEINNYFTGAFRFFLITDFSSPFEDKGEYLKSALYWVPLIIGKIFIAFGIYEMIQAFRKFKA